MLLPKIQRTRYKRRTGRTLWAKRCCWRLKLDDLSLELELRTDDRARDAKARCIVTNGKDDGEVPKLKPCSQTPAQCNGKGRTR